MVKLTSDYVCQSCGAVSNKWHGKCPSCGTWDSLTVEASAAGAPGGVTAKAKRRAKTTAIESMDAQERDVARIATGIGELDRAVGDGFAHGSAVLLSGEPGIGKSTLLLQAAAAIATGGHTALYFSGEEATGQIRMRGARLGLSGSPLGLVAETCVERILATVEAAPPDFVVIDSIQTLWTESIESAPGTVSQVRASMQALIALAKSRGTIVVVVGHVTKDGQIAGPKVIEHMVDTVLTFEGETSHNLRLLRATKNRFGPANEIGVFDMHGDGLREVANPSAIFLSERDSDVPGSAIFAGIEGTRPLLVEVQALLAASPYAAPRRAVVGWDQNRLSMILAVLEARCGIKMSNQDVYLNVAGGLRIQEPAADLAVAAALLSAHAGTALPRDSVYFGEIGLSGLLRPVQQTAARLREAQKLGFRSAHLPTAGERADPGSLRLCRLGELKDLAILFE